MALVVAVEAAARASARIARAAAASPGGQTGSGTSSVSPRASSDGTPALAHARGQGGKRRGAPRTSRRSARSQARRNGEKTVYGRPAPVRDAPDVGDEVAGLRARPRRRPRERGRRPPRRAPSRRATTSLAKDRVRAGTPPRARAARPPGAPSRSTSPAPRSRSAASSSRRQPSMNAVRAPERKRAVQQRGVEHEDGHDAVVLARARGAARGGRGRAGRGGTRRWRCSGTPGLRRGPTAGSPRVDSGHARPRRATSRSSRSASSRCPTSSCPLHIFEERYKTMIGACLERGARVRDRLGRRRRAARQIGLRDARSPRCSSAWPDGRLNIVASGTRPFRIIEARQDDLPYPAGTVEFLDDKEEVPDPAAADAAHEAYADARRAGDRPHARAGRDRGA